MNPSNVDFECGRGRLPRVPDHPMIRRGTGGLVADEGGIEVPGLGGGGLAWLSRGSTHEFLSGVGEGVPAIAWLSALAASAVRSLHTGGDTVAWVGRRVWPTPWVIAASGLECAAMLLVDVDGTDERMWAADQGLRAGVVVVADGSGFDMAASRRLALAAEAGGSVGFFARPSTEEKTLTAACSRWRVRPVVTSHPRAAWRVERIRCRASPLSVDEPPAWVLEWALESERGGWPGMTFRGVADEESVRMVGGSDGTEPQAGDGGVAGGMVDRPCAAEASQRVA